MSPDSVPVNFTTIIKLLAATLKRGHVAGASCDARSFEVNEKGGSLKGKLSKLN